MNEEQQWYRVRWTVEEMVQAANEAEAEEAYADGHGLDFAIVDLSIVKVDKCDSCLACRGHVETPTAGGTRTRVGK